MKTEKESTISWAIPIVFLLIFTVFFVFACMVLMWENGGLKYEVDRLKSNYNLLETNFNEVLKEKTECLEFYETQKKTFENFQKNYFKTPPPVIELKKH